MQGMGQRNFLPFGHVKQKSAFKQAQNVQINIHHNNMPI